MPKVSFEKLSEIIHEVKNERVIVSGIILRLKRFDKRLSDVVDNINDIISESNDERNNG